MFGNGGETMPVFLGLKKATFMRYLKILVICIFILLVAVQAGKSFMLDEIDFPLVSHAASQTLKPIYYRGEANPAEVGTYHPTFYINSLALFLRIFGYNEASVRFFGAICVLLSAYLLVRILRQLTRKNETAELLLLGLYLLNPYTIASATLPDIDSTVLPVLLLLFVYLSIKFLLQKRDMSNRSMYILGAVFALVLWSKLTTPLAIPPFLACLAIITSKNYRNGLLFALKVTLLGAAAFVITYFAYCKLLGLSTTYTYHFLLESFTKGTNTQGPLVGAYNNLKNLRQFIYWPTIPIAGLLGVSIISVLVDKARDDKARVRRLLVVTGLLITFFYIALIAPFGGFFKYPFPAFGILLLSTMFFYERYLRTVKIRLLYAFVVAAFGFVLEKLVWQDKMFMSGQPFKFLLPLLVAVVVVYVLMRRFANNKLSAVLFLSIIFFAIGFQLSISRVQAIAPYPTKYDYGQLGMDQAAAYLRANTSPNEAIWSMKDIGYYVNNKYYESYEYYFNDSLDSNLIHMLKGGKVRYYVTTTGIGQDDIDYYSNVRGILDKYAVKQKQFGNYIIYKSKE